MYYYKGLKEWQTESKNERLINVFLSSQDHMKKLMNYFKIDYDPTDLKYQDVMKQANHNLL